jgi:hypothetical protein
MICLRSGGMKHTVQAGHVYIDYSGPPRAAT